MIKFKRKYLLLLFLFISITETSLTYEKPKKIVFSISSVKVDTIGKWLIDIYTEAFHRIEIKFDVEFVPRNRAAEVANAGIVDGEIERVYSYIKGNSNLIRVEENSRLIVFSAFSLDKSIELDNWSSIDKTNYSYGYRLGIKLIERELKNRVPENNITSARKIDSIASLLENKRIDIYIEIQDYVSLIQKSRENDTIKKLHKIGIMEKISAHAYLHKKHKKLEPELSKVLADMKKEGIFKIYMDKHNLNLEW